MFEDWNNDGSELTEQDADEVVNFVLINSAIGVQEMQIKVLHKTFTAQFSQLIGQSFLYPTALWLL
jgi:hypothetical protein